MIPLFSEDDFAGISSLPSLPKSTRIFVTMAQMQELMAAVVESATQHLGPIDLCLLTARMPAGPRIPVRLLEPDVFLVGDLYAESKRLATQGLRFLTIDNKLVRHSLDTGDNSIAFEWFNDALTPQAWTAFTESIVSLGFTREAAQVCSSGQ
jgi:hypothetical protein